MDQGPKVLLGFFLGSLKVSKATRNYRKTQKGVQVYCIILGNGGTGHGTDTGPAEIRIQVYCIILGNGGTGHGIDTGPAEIRI